MGWNNAGGWGGQGWGRAAAVVASTATWNPSDVGSSITLSNGNLTATSSGSTQPLVRATASHSTGKFYFEYTIVKFTANESNIGWTNAAEALTTGNLYSDTNSFCYRVADQLYLNGTGAGFAGAVGNGTVIGFAVDFTAKLAWITINGTTWTGSGNPSTGTGGFNIAALTGGPWFPALIISTSADSGTANFGATGYTYTAPSGFGNV